jgi:membrane protein
MNKAIAVIKRILRDIERKHLQLVAAGLAYYFLLYLFPALVLLIALMAYLPLQDGMETITSFMGYLMPPQGVLLIEQMLTTISPHRTGLLWFAIVTMAWFASVGVKGIISGLDIVYEVRVPRILWINRIIAFGLTFAVGLLLMLGVLLTLAGPTLERMLSAVVPVQSLWIQVWPYLQWLLSRALWSQLPHGLGFPRPSASTSIILES